MKILRQSTAVTLMMGPFLDPTDGVTPVNSITSVPRLSKAGANFGARSSAGAVTNNENGYFTVPLDTTDTNTLGELRIAFTDATEHVPVWTDFTIVAAAAYDAQVAATGNGIRADVQAMAANTVTASALATDAVTEIQAGLATAAALATVQADTDDIQTRLPAALVSGRIDASVGAMAAGTITAAAIATDAIDADAIAASAVTEIQAGLATAVDVAAVPGDTWDVTLASHVAAGSTGEALNAAGGAGDPWITSLPGAYTAGQAGFILGTNLDALVSSRATATALATLSTALLATDLTVAAASSTTEVRTNATLATNTYNGMILVVFNTGTGAVVARRIISYSVTNGAFTVGALPFTPAAGQRAVVLAIPASAFEVAFAA